MAGQNLEDHLSDKEEGPTAILSRQSAWPHSIVMIATEVFRRLGYGRQASVTEARAQLDGLFPIPACATVVSDEDFTEGHSTAKRAHCHIRPRSEAVSFRKGTKAAVYMQGSP